MDELLTAAKQKDARERSVTLRQQKQQDQGDQQRRRFERSAVALHEIERRADDLEHTDAEAARAWLEWRVLDTRCSRLKPIDIEPAQRQHLATVQNCVQRGLRQARAALGHSDAASLDAWIGLQRDFEKLSAKVAASLDAVAQQDRDAAHAAFDAPVPSAAVERWLATLSREVNAWEAEQLSVPFAVQEHHSSIGPDTHLELVAKLPGGPSKALAEEALNLLARVVTPAYPGVSEPSVDGWRTGIAWMIGLALALFGLGAFLIVGPWSERLGVAAILASVVVAVGVPAVVAVAIAERNARRRWQDGWASFDRYSSAVVAAVAWNRDVTQAIQTRVERIGELRELADRIRDVEEFAADPDRGGYVERLEEQRPDLTALVENVAAFGGELS